MLLYQLWNFFQSRVEISEDHTLLCQISWQLLKDRLGSHLDKLEIISESRKIWHTGQRLAVANTAVTQIPAVKFDPLNDWQVQLINLVKGLLTEISQPCWFCVNL